MKQYSTSAFKLGIISGGQLGKILIQAASSWDVNTYVLDPSEDCPASKVANGSTKGDILDYDTVVQFGQDKDMIALEIENVNVDALMELKNRGVKVYPDPSILSIIQDKGEQKLFYDKQEFPTSPFVLYADENEIKHAIQEGKLGLPFVQKTRTAGYDGRGVKVVKDENDVDDLLHGPSLVEELVDIKKELAVIVAQNESGDRCAFPTVEMVFNEEANLVEQLICPAAISMELAREAEDLAIQLIEKMGLHGILAVEFFLTHDDQLVINEVAPRPHNSGHHTIEANITSQYEQYLRAIFNYPLGSTNIKMASVMINLLGEPGYSGQVKYEGLKESLAIEGVKPHIYGKTDTRPFRKMGHVTILDEDLNKAIDKANQVKQHLKVKSWQNQS